MFDIVLECFEILPGRVIYRVLIIHVLEWRLVLPVSVKVQNVSPYVVRRLNTIQDLIGHVNSCSD